MPNTIHLWLLADLNSNKWFIIKYNMSCSAILGSSHTWRVLWPSCKMWSRRYVFSIHSATVFHWSSVCPGLWRSEMIRIAFFLFIWCCMLFFSPTLLFLFKAYSGAPPTDEKEKIIWVRFERADINGKSVSSSKWHFFVGSCQKTCDLTCVRSEHLGWEIEEEVSVKNVAQS